MHLRYHWDSWHKMALGKSAHQNVDVIECAMAFASSKGRFPLWAVTDVNCADPGE